MLNPLIDMLGYVGNLLDLPGSSVRDLLSGQNPFDQWATPFSDENRASGRDVLAPLLGRNEETGMSGWLQNPMEGVKDVAGFGLEMAADPLNLVSLSPLWRALKGRKAARMTNAGIDAIVQHPERMRLAEQMSQAFGESGAHTMDLIDSFAIQNRMPADKVHGLIDVGPVQNPLSSDVLQQPMNRADGNAGQVVVHRFDNGIGLTTQRNVSGDVVPVTTMDGREFVHVIDESGRGTWFYRSFAGTGGKQQGRWFPVGGVAASPGGSTKWIIKGDVVNDKGYGRQALADLEDRVNSVMPTSDADVNTFFNQLGVSDIYAPKNEKPASYQLLPKTPGANYEPDEMSSLLQKWKNDYLNKTWGSRDVSEKQSTLYQNPLSSDVLQQPMNRQDAGRTVIQAKKLWDRGQISDEEFTNLMQENLPIRTQDESGRIPDLVKAARGLMTGDVTKEQYASFVDQYKPVRPYETAPTPVTDAEVMERANKKIRGNWKTNTDKIEEGADVGIRLDIPSYTNDNLWINTVHGRRASTDAGSSGPLIGYTSAVRLKNAKFATNANEALNVAADIKSKSPFATIEGQWIKTSPDDVYGQVQDIVNNPDRYPEWTQVGMDPERHAGFYDRANHRQLIDGAEEVLQVGPLVLAKNASKKPAVFYQNPVNPRGQIAFEGDRMRISPISPDVSTAPHEMAHAVRRMLQPEHMNEAAGMFGDWDVPAEEAFSQGAESWLQRTNTTSPAMAGTMDFFNRQLSDIYESPMAVPEGADQLYSKVFGITANRSPLDRAAMPSMLGPAMQGALYQSLARFNTYGGTQ
jgi:hypothetical protein